MVQIARLSLLRAAPASLPRGRAPPVLCTAQWKYLYLRSFSRGSVFVVLNSPVYSSSRSASQISPLSLSLSLSPAVGALLLIHARRRPNNWPDVYDAVATALLGKYAIVSSPSPRAPYSFAQLFSLPVSLVVLGLLLYLPLARALLCPRARIYTALRELYNKLLLLLPPSSFLFFCSVQCTGFREREREGGCCIGREREREWKVMIRTGGRTENEVSMRYCGTCVYVYACVSVWVWKGGKGADKSLKRTVRASEEKGRITSFYRRIFRRRLS